MEIPRTSDGKLRRSMLHNNIIHINTAHPDFVSRMKGNPV